MRNAFSCFVFGSYQRFLPYYVLSICKNYPNSDIIIFFETTLEKKIHKYLLGCNNVILYNNFDFKEHKEWIEDAKIRGGGSKTLLRFLIKKHYFTNYDHIYFGDVDILVLNEKENLFDFHKKQADKNNLPFSNRVRPLPNDNCSPSRRLTGLHFVVVKPYFNKINDLIINFLNNETFRNKIMDGVKRDEELLYNLNMLAFNFDPFKLLKNKRPWHGFHLGLVRGKNFLNLQTLKENSSLSIDELKKELSLLNKNGEINHLLKSFYCREVYYTYKSLDLNLPFWITLYYESNHLKSKLIKRLKKIKNSL